MLKSIDLFIKMVYNDKHVKQKCFTLLGGSVTLEETIRANMLFDMYGNLLTNNQYDVLYAYISQNESLAEIASHTTLSPWAFSAHPPPLP